MAELNKAGSDVGRSAEIAATRRAAFDGVQGLRLSQVANLPVVGEILYLGVGQVSMVLMLWLLGSTGESVW